jgi:hypothetical protein
MSTCDPFAKRLTISCTVMTSCDSQDRLYLKPCCASDKMLESQLVITVQEIVKRLAKGSQVDIILLDFAKAFDMVPHARRLGVIRKKSNF